MADKDWAPMLDALLPHASRVVATHVGRRGLPPSRLAAAIGDRVPVDVVDDARSAIAHARTTTPAEGVVVVTGSLFLAGETYAALGGDRPLVAPWQGWDRIGTQARP
jgi:dihydrofolate synthase/folylpolyglutamate synthase